MDFLRYQTGNRDARHSSVNPVFVAVVRVLKGVTETQSNKMGGYEKAAKKLPAVNRPTVMSWDF